MGVVHINRLPISRGGGLKRRNVCSLDVRLRRKVGAGHLRTEGMASSVDVGPRTCDAVKDDPPSEQKKYEEASTKKSLNQNHRLFLVSLHIVVIGCSGIWHLIKHEFVCKKTTVFIFLVNVWQMKSNDEIYFQAMRKQGQKPHPCHCWSTGGHYSWQQSGSEFFFCGLNDNRCICFNVVRKPTNAVTSQQWEKVQIN